MAYKKRRADRTPTETLGPTPVLSNASERNAAMKKINLSMPLIKNKKSCRI
jgi:hypothetical protein